MSARDAIAESWYLRTVATYRAEAQEQLLGRKDRFRNPAGHQLRESLVVLTEELQSGMDLARVVQALDAIVRIRAVQDFSASDAVRFVFLAKDAFGEHGSNAELDRRVDQLALLAFDIYTACREQIASIRARETANVVTHRGACQ